MRNRYANTKHALDTLAANTVIYFIIGQCISKEREDWKCNCSSGWIGPFCDRPDCDKQYCKNGGTCSTDAKHERVCACTNDYDGTTCEDKICKDDSCNRHGLVFI